MFLKLNSHIAMEQPSIPKMSEGLFRQRRNLILTSLTIIFLRYGEVTIEKFGTSALDLKFQNLNAIFVALWVVFFYFLVRYYQYLRQEPDLGIKSAFWAKVDARCLNKLTEDAKSRFATVLMSPARLEFQLSSFKRTSVFLWSGSVTTKRTGSGEPMNSEYTVNVLHFWPDFTVAACHVALNRSAITDYVLPFLLALSALLYGWSGNWPGTFCNVFHISILRHSCT